MAIPAVSPDGGWGWVIVVCTFVISFLSCGTISSVGIIFDEFIAEFHCTKSEVSVIASILFSLQCFLGPVVSLLQQKFQDKKIVMVGSVLITISFVTSSFAPNVICLYITMGVLAGIGSAFVYMPLVVLISFYFSQRRSLATALGFLGGHVGSFIHPYLIRMLVSFFDWRGAFLIIGGLALNSLPLAILLRPIIRKQRRMSNSEAVEEQFTVPHAAGESNDASRKLETIFPARIAGCNEAEEMPDELLAVNDTEISMTPERNESISSAQSLRKPKLPPTVLPQKYSNRQFSEIVKKPLTPILDFRRRQISVPSFGKQSAAGVSLKGRGVPVKGSPTLSPAPLAHQTSYSSAFGSSILGIPIFDPVLAPASLFGGLNEVKEGLALQQFGTKTENQQIAESNATIGVKPADETDIDLQEKQQYEIIESLLSASSVAHQASVTVSLASSLQKLPPVTKKDSRFRSIMAPFFRHFSNPGFSGFVASNFLLCLAYYTPTVFIVHWGNELEISNEKTTLLLSLIGMGNIVGRPLFSFTADRWTHFRIPLFGIMVGIAGAVTTLTPLFANFYFLVFFAFQFGFLAGTSQTLLTPILADMVPLYELSHAFGVLILVDGIALLIGPPLLAILPTYDFTFAVSGLIMMVSSLVLIGPKCIPRLLSQFKSITCQKRESQNVDRS